jgi:branched-chain amino acid aminotransferase
MAAEQVWLNGRVVPATEATVSVFDHGITVGDGCFETVKALDGIPVAVRRHLERLRRSAEGLGLRVPFTDDELRDAIQVVLGSAELPVARVRVTVTGGAAPLGSERGDGPATVIVAAGPMEMSNAPTPVCTVPWPRNERGALAGLKTTSYAENVRALSMARAQGCSEAIFTTTRGLLCEGTGSNVFVVHDGRLITPTLATGCLAGVTRALVLEVTDAVEADLPMDQLPEVTEAFLTSTGRDVQPIDRWDGRDLGDPGPHTLEAAALFAALSATDDDP